jgi:hypothetical protein
MTERSPVQQGSKTIDKALLQQVVAALEERMGFRQDPTATGEKAQALLRAHGIQPDDRFLSSEIRQMRRDQAEGS